MPKIFEKFGKAGATLILSQYRAELLRRAVKAQKQGNPITDEELSTGLEAEWQKAKTTYSMAGVTLDDLLNTGREALAAAADGESAEELPKMLNVVKTAVEKIGRNEKCPCGSGLKYKKCCGRDK